MKAAITGLVSIGGKDGVAFNCEAGAATGVWNSKRPLPRPGSVISVEIDVEPKMAIGINASYVSQGATSIEQRGAQSVLLKIKVEAVDDDGLVYGRLSRDCLVMIETEERASGEGIVVGRCVEMKIKPEELSLTPI